MAFSLSEVALETGAGAPPTHSHTATLVSHAAYHLDELVPMAMALSKRGVRPRLLLVEATAGVLQRFRSQHRRYSRSIKQLERQGMRLTKQSISSDDLVPDDALVVMNDWGPCRELVDAISRSGGISFGKVEGAQDFADVDSGKDRNAYGRVDVVLGQGPNDAAALANRDCIVVGNSRLERVLNGPARSTNNGLTVINSNFSYGQLVEHRRSWLQATYGACETASLPFRVSRHPADRGLIPPWKRSRHRIEDLIVTAPALISRFSSVCFEALAHGVPLAYFNPHGESAAPFTDPQGAFVIARTESELAEVLQSVRSQSSEDVRARAEGFLAAQVDRTSEPAADRAADAIVSRLRS